MAKWTKAQKLAQSKRLKEAWAVRKNKKARTPKSFTVPFKVTVSFME